MMQVLNSLRPSDAYMGHHWFRYWLVACSAPSHYLNQCWNGDNWTFRKKLQWNFNRNSNIFIHEIAFENVVWIMASILSRPQWVNSLRLNDVYMHISQLTITGSDNGLSPDRCQAIIWINAGILLTRALGTIFKEILIRIQIFSFKKMHLKMSSAKWCPFCLALNVSKSLLIEVKNLFILQNQCHGCWWPGNGRSRGISSHGIDLVLQWYSGFSMRRANYTLTHWPLGNLNEILGT